MKNYRPRKPRKSCDQCAELKIGCTKEKPHCSRCVRRKMPCTYSLTRRPGRPSRSGNNSILEESGSHSSSPRLERYDLVPDVTNHSPGLALELFDLEINNHLSGGSSPSAMLSSPTATITTTSHDMDGLLTITLPDDPSMPMEPQSSGPWAPFPDLFPGVASFEGALGLQQQRDGETTSDINITSPFPFGQIASFEDDIAVTTIPTSPSRSSSNIPTSHQQDCTPVAAPAKSITTQQRSIPSLLATKTAKNADGPGALLHSTIITATNKDNSASWPLHYNQHHQHQQAEHEASSSSYLSTSFSGCKCALRASMLMNRIPVSPQLLVSGVFQSPGRQQALEATLHDVQAYTKEVAAIMDCDQHYRYGWSHDGSICILLSLVLFRVLECYRAIVALLALDQEDGKDTRISQPQRSGRPSLFGPSSGDQCNQDILQRPLSPPEDAGENDFDRVALQTVLSNLHSVQGIVKRFSKLNEASNIKSSSNSSVDEPESYGSSVKISNLSFLGVPVSILQATKTELHHQCRALVRETLQRLKERSEFPGVKVRET